MNTPQGTPEEKNEICEKAFESIYPSCGCKDLDLLESLKDILGNDIADRIKNFNRYAKPVLFISVNISLIGGAVAYLWYTHDQGRPPLVLDCSGLKEDEVLTMVEGDWIESAFTNIEYSTEFGGILFLECLNPYENTLKRLRSKVKDNKEPGILVIGMDKTGDLSQGFLGRFEVIRLEPEKQSKAEGVPQSKAGKDFVPFLVPSGTQWHEVKISFFDNENVKISAKNETENRHYSQMGFKDSKNSKPVFLWKFLKELACLSGRYTNCPDKEKHRVKKNFSDLRKALRQVFKTIEGDPIPERRGRTLISGVPRKGYCFLTGESPVMVKARAM